jgi:hypothetical protein
MALPPGRTISGAYGYSGGTPAGLWTPNPYGMAAPPLVPAPPPIGYVANPTALPTIPIKKDVAFGTAKPAVFSAAAAPAGGVMRTPSEPLSDTTGPVHKAVPKFGYSDPRYSFFNSSEGGVRRKTRRSRRKTSRRRGGKSRKTRHRR